MTHISPEARELLAKADVLPADQELLSTECKHARIADGETWILQSGALRIVAKQRVEIEHLQQKDVLAAERDALCLRVKELEGAINAHLEALERHDKSNDGFGKSRDTYAEAIGALADLRRLLKRQDHSRR